MLFGADKKSEANVKNNRLIFILNFNFELDI